MKKIVFIINKLSGGGAERVLSILANRFSKDYKVDILTVVSDEITYKTEQSINVIHIERSKSKFRIMRFINRIKLMRKIIKQNKYDYIVSFLYDINIYTILSKIGLRKPKLIISERNDPYNEPKSKIIRMIRNFLYKRTDAIVFQTEEAKRYFKNSTHKKSYVISNPLNPEIKDFISTKNSKSDTIIGIGRLEEQKDFETLIKAFSLFKEINPTYKLIIFGTGPLKEQLENLSINLGIQNEVIFKGYVNNIYQEMSNSKCFVLSSKFEGISNALLEAMSLGLPVISTDCPIYGSRSVINHEENGFLVPVGDFKKISYYLDLILNNEQIYDKISNNALEINVTNDIENLYLQWREIVDKIK